MQRKEFDQQFYMLVKVISGRDRLPGDLISNDLDRVDVADLIVRTEETFGFSVDDDGIVPQKDDTTYGCVSDVLFKEFSAVAE